MTNAITPADNGTGFKIIELDGEPRIRDVELGEALGFQRPRDLRKLVARWSRELGPVCAIVAQTPGGGRPGRENWLTEAQALFLCAKSDTPRATAITQHVIAVFRTAVRATFAAVNGESDATSQAVLMLAEALRSIQGEVAALRRDLDQQSVHALGSAGNPHCIGPAHARRFLARLREVAVAAAWGAGHKRPSTRYVQSLRKSMEIEVRARVGFDGAGSKWERCPATKIGAAYLVLEEIDHREQQRAAHMRRMVPELAGQLALAEAS